MTSDTLHELLDPLFQAGNLPVKGFTLDDLGEGEFYMNLDVEEDSARLIGRRGDVLISLEHLVKNVLRAQGLLGDGKHIKIDIDSYRKQQEYNVQVMAEQRAQRVLESGRTVTLPPMSPFFRRLVHLHIKSKFPSLETSSRGSGNDRAVCIALAEGAQADDMPEMGDIYSEIDL